MQPQRGAALPYVLALLAILGILVAITWRTIRNNNNLAAIDRGNAQARLVSVAGLDHALAKIGPAESHQNLGFATEGLIYRLDGDEKFFTLRVRSWGLFARAVSRGESSLPPPGRVREATGILGMALDLGRLPAVGLLNHDGNMVLAGNAQVTGPVMLWKGSVRKSTDYHLRWSGDEGHVGPLWDSTASAWKWVEPDFDRAEAWMDVQAKLLVARDFEKDADFDSGSVRDIVLPDSGILVDTVISDARIVAGKFLKVGNGVRLQNCKLLSQRIRVEGDAVLNRVIAYAGKNLEVIGGHIHGGQYLAVDTLRIESKNPMEGYPVFYARGRMKNKNRPDSAMVGAMQLLKATGEGLFLAPFRGRPLYDQEIRMTVLPATRLTGLLYCGGSVQMEGTLQGSLICQNFRFENKGTIWLGHLNNAQISSLSKKRIIFAPLIFPGFAPILFGAKGK